MKYKKLLIVLTAVTALGIAGCGKSSKETAEVTPTPVPTAAPTAAPATSTPLPTSTPAPKLIGVKTSTAKFVYLTNSTKGEIREIYLRAAGAAFLLCNSTLHITDIAFSSGYNSRQHFAHTFEKFYHMSPSRYRSLHTRPLRSDTEKKRYHMADGRKLESEPFPQE